MQKIAGFLRKTLGVHLWLLTAVLSVLLFWQFRGNKGLMNLLCEKVTSPVKRFLGSVCSLLPISVMELSIAVLVILGLWWIGRTIFLLIKKEEKLLRFYRRLIGLLAAGITVYAGFCLLWGINYYTDTLEEKMGLYAEPTSVQDLYETAMVFVEKLNAIEPSVKRDEQGLFAEDMDTVWAQTDVLYQNVSAEYEFLSGKTLTPKKVICSKIMSYMGFTGVFCPFTGEANLNIDSPDCFRPSTIAHEIAHQKNIAMEQEANFVAILTCDKSGITAYQYAGYLLGFVHLNNAIYKYDKVLWEKVITSLNQGAIADLNHNNDYWASFEGKVSEASEQVYENFLQSYDQELGMQSYGAVVDLLIAYYCP